MEDTMQAKRQVRLVYRGVPYTK